MTNRTKQTVKNHTINSNYVTIHLKGGDCLVDLEDFQRVSSLSIYIKKESKGHTNYVLFDLNGK